MVNSISIKQVIYYYKNFIVENELWCILLASLQDQYRKLKTDFPFYTDISSDTVLLQSDGEISIISHKKKESCETSYQENLEKRFINSLGCFISYLIKLNDSSIAISDELRALIAFMVNEENQFTFSIIFEEAYRLSCFHLNIPYQRIIRKIFEITLQRILDANQRNELDTEEYSVDSLNRTRNNTKNSFKQSQMDNNNINRTSGDGQSSPDLTDKKYSSHENDGYAQQHTMNTETLESSILAERDQFRHQRKFFLLIEKVKKRKIKLKALRSKLHINYDNDNDSEFEGLEFTINQPANSLNNYETTNIDETNYNSKLARANETINTSTGTVSDKIRHIPSKKFYDIRRIPPLLKFDDPLENIHKDSVNVIVKLITESKFEFKCSGLSTCKQIFEYIIAYLDLTEQNLFGLFIYADNEYYFVDLDEKLHKVVSKWRRKDLAKDSIELYLKIKIYLTDINSLHDPLTLQFYYWELRRQFTNDVYHDINEDKISPTDELPLLFQLAVLAFHAEGGELNELNYLYDNYIPERYLTEVSLFEIQLLELFKMISTSQTSYQSLVQFTNVIINHKSYGYHFFRYYTRGNNTSNNTSINSLSKSFTEKANQNYVGISLSGLTIFKTSKFEDQHKKQFQSEFYKWQQIEKLVCERKKISIQLRSTIEQQQQHKRSSSSKHLRISVNINSEKKSKSIVKLSQSLSRFAMAIEQRSLNKINIPTTLFEAYSDVEDENYRNSAVYSTENINSINNSMVCSGGYNNKSLLNISQQTSDSKYLLKEILSDQDTSYIKVFQVRKNKNQKFGLTFDENKTFNCKIIQKISKVDNVCNNTSLAVGDLILCINNEIKFNELSCKELENYLDTYSGYIRILLLSKENVEKLLHSHNETYKPQVTNIFQHQSQEVQKENKTPSENIAFEDTDSGNYNTTTQMITKPTNSQILANIDGLSIKSSVTSDQDSVDFEYLSKMNKTKSIKGLFSLVQPSDKNDAEAMNLNNNQVISPNTSLRSVVNFDENFIKIDFNKVFKTTLQKNSNNELGFTVTKLPNGYSCIKEILHEPALLNRSIQTGDIIISVNKSQTKSLSHRDVVTYLRIAGSIVELELYRPDAETILPYLTNRKNKKTHYAKSLNDDSKENFVEKIETEIPTQKVIKINDEEKYGDIEADELDQVVTTNEAKNKTDTKLIEKRPDIPASPISKSRKRESFKKNMLSTSLVSSTSQLLQFEYSMKDFLRLNLVLSTEKIDENDDAESLIENLNSSTNSAKKSIIPKPTNSLDKSLNTSLLYVKSIKKFDTIDETEKNLQPNDLIIKINEQVVSTLEEFKLMLYNLNKIFLATNTPQIVSLTVKRRLKPNSVDLNVSTNRANSNEIKTSKSSNSQNTSNIVSNENKDQSEQMISKNSQQISKDDLSDVNISIGSSSLRTNNNEDSLIESNSIKNFLLWFSSSKFSQFFFPLYSHDNVITEEYLQAYNMFKNLDTTRLENLFEAFKIKILGKTQDYIQEFKLLKIESVLTDSSKIANYNEENRCKNRYRNVVPYDFNRVKLIENPQNNDYINASHICLPLHPSTKSDTGEQYVVNYILGQPPLNNTISDFLIMLWEQNIHLIVMLLTNDEINKLKCPKYWPTKETPVKEFPPNFQITLVSCQNLDDHIYISYCELANLNENKKRNIFICQYTDDIQSVQTQSNELTYFNQFNRLQTFMNLIHIYHQKGPLLVYCLNGLGRTGLFLCIYYYLTLFKTDFFLNSTNTNFIFDTVKLLRTQRFGVIQTKEQYKYCYTFFLQLFSQKLNALNNQELQSS